MQPRFGTFGGGHRHVASSIDIDARPALAQTPDRAHFHGLIGNCVICLLAFCARM